MRDTGHGQLMRRRPVLGNGFVNGVFDLLEDHNDDQITLPVRVAIDGWYFQFEPAQQMVAAQREATPKLDEARLAPKVDHECIQIVDVFVGELSAQAIDGSFHSRPPLVQVIPQIRAQIATAILPVKGETTWAKLDETR